MAFSEFRVRIGLPAVQVGIIIRHGHCGRGEHLGVLLVIPAHGFYPLLCCAFVRYIQVTQGSDLMPWPRQNCSERIAWNSWRCAMSYPRPPDLAISTASRSASC